MTLSDFVSRLVFNDQQGDMMQIWKLDVNDPLWKQQFNSILDNLSIDNQVKILELATISAFIQNVDSPIIREVITKYRLSFFTLNEPIEQIERTATALSQKGQGRGRPPEGSKSKIKAFIKNINIQEIGQSTNNERVYIHNLYTKQHDRTSYAVTSRSHKTDAHIRILKPSQDIGWRDANPYELPIYSAHIDSQTEVIQNYFDQFDVYGSIFEDGKFRIHDMRKKIKSKDKRKNNRGMVSTSWKKPDLIEVLWHLKVQPLHTDIIMSNNELINYLRVEGVERTGLRLDEFDEAKLHFFFRWYYSGKTRSDISVELQRAMVAMGRVLIDK
jgi:hypothetical protein